jgi:dTMP kinase
LRGKFISFEGMDGCGKTTQMRRLAARLRQAGREVVETVEPGGTAIGGQIRQILLSPANERLSPEAEMLLYFASRAQNVNELVLPALEAGKIVLTDRFTDSTMAYQGYGRALGPENVRMLDRFACRGLAPDLTLLIDIDLETSLARARARNLSEQHLETRMDEQPVAFYQAVRAAYHRMAAEEPQRFRVIDGRAAADDVELRVWEALAPHV